MDKLGSGFLVKEGIVYFLDLGTRWVLASSADAW